jgi:hypothetical protein
MYYLGKNKKATKIRLLLILLFLSLILISNYLFQKSFSTSVAKFLEITRNGEEIAMEGKLKLYKTNFTKFCEDYGEWDMLVNRRVYVKRKGAFYFIDADFFRVLVLIRGERDWSLTPRKFHFKINFLELNEVVQSQFVNDTDIHFHDQDLENEYAAILIETRLRRKNNYPKKSFDSMDVTVIDVTTKSESKMPLNVKIKYLLGDRAKKKSMMHCSKCLHLSKKEDLVDLEWSIKLHKKIGFDKKYICDHMIEKDKSFTTLFNKHREFLEIDELKCIPNLQDHPFLLNQSYLVKHTDLCDKSSIYVVRKFDVINTLIVNECYMNNLDKYRFIKVADADEMVIPKQIEKMSTLCSVQEYLVGIDYSRFEQEYPFSSVSCKRNRKIESYLDRLVASNSAYKNATSFHFKYGMEPTYLMLWSMNFFNIWK